MSVHGEYARALEALLICVKQLDSPHARVWASDLAESRTSQNADLSAAARACSRVLDAIDAERSLSSAKRPGPDSDPLREPFLSLRAHCRAILGLLD